VADNISYSDSLSIRKYRYIAGLFDSLFYMLPCRC